MLDDFAGQHWADPINLDQPLMGPLVKDRHYPMAAILFLPLSVCRHFFQALTDPGGSSFGLLLDGLPCVPYASSNCIGNWLYSPVSVLEKRLQPVSTFIVRIPRHSAYIFPQFRACLRRHQNANCGPQA